MSIDNGIFNHYRELKQKEQSALDLLLKNGYTVFDSKGNKLYQKKIKVESSR